MLQFLLLTISCLTSSQKDGSLTIPLTESQIILPDEPPNDYTPSLPIIATPVTPGYYDYG